MLGLCRLSIEKAGLHRERRMELKSRENNKDKITLAQGSDRREAMSVTALFPLLVLAALLLLGVHQILWDPNKLFLLM